MFSPDLNKYDTTVAIVVIAVSSASMALILRVAHRTLNEYKLAELGKTQYFPPIAPLLLSPRLMFSFCFMFALCVLALAGISENLTGR